MMKIGYWYFRDESNSLQLAELVELFSTFFILEGVDKDKAVGKKPFYLDFHH